MASSCFYNFNILFVSMLLLPLAASLLAGAYSPSVICDAQESSALLQFKASFVIDKLASSHPLAYPKVHSWSVHGDCCSWDGVHCGNGHVIGLDLSSSCLFGSIHSNTTLFNLSHLQWLSLADNHFNYSPIPPEISLLSTTLTHLNLSKSYFAGTIPPEISILSKLTVLDLGLNADISSSTRYLQLNHPTFADLVQNASKLEHLILSLVDISSTVPNMMSNLSLLSTLFMKSCNLVGEFPSNVFLLPNLEYISIRFNQNLTGHLPPFDRWSPLKTLLLGGTRLSGPIPPSLGNLTNLTDIDFSETNFKVGDLSWLAELKNLQRLLLTGINISSEIPHSFATLSHLRVLSLKSCQLSGELPFWIHNLTKLTHVDLESNFLQGPLTKFIFSKLVNLEVLYLALNNFSGTLNLGMFHEMPNLTMLGFGGNHLLDVDDYNGTLPNLHVLELTSCNLRRFPNFLKHQQNLEWLILGSTRIHGPIPTWFCNISKETLRVLDVSNNFLTGFAKCVGWKNVEYLDLSHNLLGGSLPTPPPSIIYYIASHNNFTGEIAPSFCNLSSLIFLELNHNSFSGHLPRCLGNMSNLSLLALNNNHFSGTIPHMCTNGINVMMEAMNFAENQLQGRLPKSLANCAALRSLNVGNNQINDAFPYWMGKLNGLQVLSLRSNRFHGAILSYAAPNNSEFPNLKVIDLSHNGFSGFLPAALLYKLKAMKKSNPLHFTYMDVNMTLSMFNLEAIGYRGFPMILANKGSEVEYGKIPNEFTALDFSSNNFNGVVPECIGNLNGLYVLNLSNNHLTGHIPRSLANLSEIESLDLSNNNLFGEIPEELAQLKFLAILNVSHNNLTGQVPRGQQFDTFEDSSFAGNVGLCGELLIKKKCRGYAEPPQMAVCYEKCEDVETSFPGTWDWIVMAVGYGGGLIVGIVMGNELMAKKPEWFIRILGRKMKPRRRSRQN